MEIKTFETEQYFGEIAPELKEKLDKLPKIFRLTGNKSGVGNRIYFTKPTENSEVTIYNSGTTIISNYKDVNADNALLKWKVGLINRGINPEEEVKERQDYGTIMHLAYGKILQGAKTNFKNLRNFLLDLRKEAHLPYEYAVGLIDRNLHEFKKDIASLLTWIKEYNIRPLGIEVMLKSDKYIVATAVDLIALADIDTEGYWGEVYASGKQKGQPKLTKKKVTQLVIVDFKSGKKGFYDKNVLQLLLTKEIVQENFPELEIGGIYNFAPNDWVGSKPTYKFYNQERETKSIDFLISIKDLVFEFGKREFEYMLKNFKSIEVVGKIDRDSSLDENYVSYINLKEEAELYWRRRYVETLNELEVFILDNELESVEMIKSFCKHLTELDLEQIEVMFGATTKKQFEQMLIAEFEKNK